MLVFAYGLVSRRLERTIVTGPIVFAVAGVVLSLVAPDASRVRDLETFRHVAEIALVMLLFTDASRTNLRLLKSVRRLPERLLSVGLLLSIALGALLAKLLLPSLSLSEAGILGAILAPTDAGLGQVIVTSPHVPKRVREALNVEAGLNDGLAVPFFLFFLALARPEASEGASLFSFIYEQLGYGVAIGAGLGLVGGKLLAIAHRREWMGAHAAKLAVLALPLLAMIVCEHVGASMFIAAFVAGITVQIPCPEVGSHGSEFAEGWGQLLSQAVFFLFGMIFLRSFAGMTAAMAGYAALSLTVVRMAPVALALLGTRTSRPTVLFMGWFGPRGLASIVLGLVFLEQEAHLAGEATIARAVVATVFLSILAHGVTATPGIKLYGKAVKALPPTSPEREGDVG